MSEIASLVQKKHGGSRKKPAAHTPEMFATVLKENKEVRAQLRRKESDFIQHMKGEWASERDKLVKAALSSDTIANNQKKAKKVAVKRAEEIEAAHAITLQELVAARLEVEGMRAQVDAYVIGELDAKASIGELRRTVAVKLRMISSRDTKIEELVAAASVKEEELAKAQALLDERLLTIRRLTGKQGGRPSFNRSEEELAECSRSAAYKSSERMSERILDVVGYAETEGAISEESLMDALVKGGWIEVVWESKVIWERRMDWAEENKDTLRLTWTPNMTVNIRDKLNVSYDMMDQLRFMLSHNRVGKRLVPRPWIRNPWTGKHVCFPQPIAPRCGVAGWTHLVKVMQEKWVLRMDAAGRVAQRPFFSTLNAAIKRDLARAMLRPSTEADPLTVVLGADGTGVGKRSITHVAISIAPSYRDGIATQNEMNLNTIATSVTDDHWGGLNETLCGSCYTDGDLLPDDSIAAAINHINRKMKLPDGTPAKVVGCFDLVAARGIRGGRGRCACHVEATTAAERFSIPPISDETTWDEAELIMRQTFPFLQAKRMRDDSHTPPEDYDYEKDGPWRCGRSGCDIVFNSRAEYLAARNAFQVAKADRTSEGKALTSMRAAKYAALHPSQQGEFEPPNTELGMKDILVDPLHCLMLNLPKVRPSPPLIPTPHTPRATPHVHICGVLV